MQNKVKQLAKTVKKDLRKNIDAVNVVEYLKQCGYSTVFFNTPAGDKEIAQYSLEDEAERRKAFTYAATAHIVFINNDNHVQDKLYLLLHELGHILLKHIGDGKMHLRNPILMDIEADAFAYELIRNSVG